MFRVLLAATLLASSPAPAATGGDTFPTIVTRDSRGGLPGAATRAGHAAGSLPVLALEGAMAQVVAPDRRR